MKRFILLIMLTFMSALFIASCTDKECTEHKYGEWQTETAASCESDGKRIRKCTECDNTEVESIAMLGHLFSSYSPDGNATCVDGTKTAICANGCGKIDTVRDEGSGSGVHTLSFAEAHPSICDAPSRSIAKCAACDYTESVTIAPAIGHLLTSYEVESVVRLEESDCQYKVTLVGKCGICGEIGARVERTEVIHKYSSRILKAATCKSMGTLALKCSLCDKPEHNEYYSAGNAHIWVAGSTVNGIRSYSCVEQGCSATKGVIEVGAFTHTLALSALSGNELKLGSVTLSLDTNACSALRDGSVTVFAERLSLSDRGDILSHLTDAQRAMLGNSEIYSIGMRSGGQSVSDLGNGKVTITLPYELSDGEDISRLTVWEISVTGAIEAHSATYYSGCVSFVTSRFSRFAVVRADAAYACEANGHKFVNGEAEVEPSCVSVGFNLMKCERCVAASVVAVTPELGHSYGSATEKIEPTCNSSGKYTYICDRVGCGHRQEILLPITHSFNATETLAPTCSTDGYIRYTCGKCGEVMTEVKGKQADLHSIYTSYEFKSGTGDCSDGVLVSYKCKNEGCAYQTAVATVYDHIPIDGISESSKNIPIDGIMPTLKAEYGDDLSVSVGVRYGGCLCGKSVTEVDFYDEKGIFEGLSDYFFVLSEAPSEELFTDPDSGYTLKLGVSNETVGCKTVYYLDIIAVYDAQSGEIDGEKRILLTTADAHDTETVAVLREGALTCADGVTVSEVCRKCGEVTEVSGPNMTGKQHYFVYTVIDDLSNSSIRSHKARLSMGICPCGASEYRITYGEGTDPMYKCDLVNIETVTETDSIIKTYACDCGIRYRETVVKERVSDCLERICQRIEYGEYDSEEDAYSDVTDEAVKDIYTHIFEQKKEYTLEKGCYREYTLSLRCECGAIYPGYSEEVKTYEHTERTEYSADSMGRSVETSYCKECGYLKKTVKDGNGSILSIYTEEPDPVSGERKVTSKLFRGGAEKYSEIRAEDKWSQSFRILISGTDMVCYTVNSLGEVEIVICQ